MWSFLGEWPPVPQSQSCRWQGWVDATDGLWQRLFWLQWGLRDSCSDRQEHLSCKETLKNTGLERSLSLGIQSVLEDQVAAKTKAQQGARWALGLSRWRLVVVIHIWEEISEVWSRLVCVCTYTAGTTSVARWVCNVMQSEEGGTSLLVTEQVTSRLKWLKMVSSGSVKLIIRACLD